MLQKGLDTNAGMRRDRILRNEGLSTEELKVQRDFTAAPY